MRSTLFFLFMFPMTTYSQLTISAFGGINPSTNVLNRQPDFFDAYCKPGITAGLSSELFLSSSVALTPSLEFASYAFDQSTSPITTTIPERRVISTSANNSHVWRMFVAVRKFVSPDEAVTVHFSTGVGYVLEQPATINVTFNELNAGSFTESFQYERSSHFVHTISAGVRWSLSRAVAVDLGSQLFTNYDDRLTTTFSLAAVYRFAD